MKLSLPDILYKISTGNEDAFRQLVQDYSDRLFQFAFSLMKNSEDAEEIIYDVFLKVWQLREQLPEGDQFLFYLYRAVKNTSLNYLKKRNKTKKTESAYYLEAVKECLQTPEDIVISNENVAQIKQVVNALPPRCRQIFILVKEDDLSYRQVAELLDISPATVNVQMSIAIRKIWQALDPARQEFLS